MVVGVAEGVARVVAAQKADGKQTFLGQVLYFSNHSFIEIERILSFQEQAGMVK